MNSRTTDNVARVFRSVFAGALGGPLCLLGVALLDKLRLGYVPYGGGLEIVAVPTFLLVGGVFGTVIAVIFSMLAAKGIYPSGVVRAIIGSAIPLAFVTFTNLVLSGKNTGVSPPTLIEAIANVLLYIGCFGALPGVAAYTKIKRHKSGVGNAT
jgi:hypothetical protein